MTWKPGIALSKVDYIARWVRQRFKASTDAAPNKCTSSKRAGSKFVRRTAATKIEELAAPAHNDFVIDLPANRVEFTRKGQCLIVTFDNAGSPHREPENRRPWGHKFFSAEGFSVLGVIAKESDWYRSVPLHDALLTLKERGFFESFSKVVFTGSSMGGFAATAFASLHPGATVISFNPQSTLRHDLVPWETGHINGRKQNWDGRFADGTDESRSAARVYIFYDPYHPADRMHADRYVAGNVIRMKCPFMGHGLPDSFNKLGILKSVFRSAINETRWNEEAFASLIRNRRTLGPYFKNLISRAVRKSDVERGYYITNLALDRFDDNYFRLRKAIFLSAKGGVDEALNILASLDLERRRARYKRRSEN